MSEYIDREALLREVMMSRPWVLNGTDNEKELTEQENFDWFENLVKNAPTADAQEVRRGKWILQRGKPEAFCSECGCEVVYQIVNDRWEFENFCPHCGAKMDKE